MHGMVLELWFKLGTMQVGQVAHKVKFQTVEVYSYMVVWLIFGVS